MARCNGRHHKRHGRDDSRIIDADEFLEKSGFKMPSPEVLRRQIGDSCAENAAKESGAQFGSPLPSPSDIERRTELFLRKSLEENK